MDLIERVVHELDAARRRSLALCDTLSEADQARQHSTLMSPVVWDLAHVGNYEDQWLLRTLGGPGVRPDLDDLYDAFRHPRAGRPQLPLLPPAAARRYIAGVRSAVLDHLETVDLDRPDPILERGFVYGMVAQHEHQHDETITATRQLMGEAAPPLPGARPSPRPAAPSTGGEVFVPGGDVPIGTDLEPWAYDNERPSHTRTVAPFFIDRTPVTNGAFAAFVAAGGYGERQWWNDEGWAFVRSESLAHPQFWRDEGSGSWSVLRFGTWRDLDPDEPVQHVNWHEATAYLAWAGRRLPTEFEWETAATWDGTRKRRWPWGDDDPTAEHANLAATYDGPAPVGSYPGGVSPWGCEQMIGDVWEWTASDFAPYPGFRSFPYREYSEVFFGSGYKVLRGGSWDTHPVTIRPTFRNWDHAIRRQIFAGFRGAKDAK